MSASTATDKNDKETIVLNAAISVFLAHGFSAATTDMVQREAGVSKATMYAFFPNKEALFEAALKRQCAKLTNLIQSMEVASGDVRKMLTQIGTSYLSSVLEPNGLALYRVAVAEAPRFPDLGRLFYLAGPKTVTSLIASRLSAASQAGEIDVQAIGVEAAAALFISMVRCEAQLECLTHPGSRPSDAQIDTWVHIAVTTFLAAFSVQK